MHQDESTHSLDVPASNASINDDAVKKRDETTLQTQQDIPKTQTINQFEMGSSSDCKPPILTSQYVPNKPPRHQQEKFDKATYPLGSTPIIIRSPPTELHNLNLRDTVTVNYAGPELTKSLNDPAVLSTQDKVPKIFYHHTYAPNEEISTNVCSTFGRHNDLQQRYRRVIINSEISIAPVSPNLAIKMADQNLYALTLEHRRLQQLYDKQQLERKLTAQKQLLKGMSDTKAVLDEIIAIPKTFCDINVRKGQPFLEIDRESGACLQNIKENALEISKGNLINAKEITIPDHLESSMEKLILDSQEQREKNKILSDLLTNTSAISHSKIKSDEKIKTDDVICIKTDSDGMKAQDLLPESPENYVDECNETKKSLYALTLQHRKLQQLYDRQQLERKLTAQKQLLKSMSDTKAVLDEIIAIPKTFCDINVRKGQPFLEIDRESGACLQNIKENALEISKGNLINAKEITIPDHLESSMEKLILDSQEQREKNKILSDLLTNTLAISHSKIKSDEKIKTDDVICIKTDSDGMKAQDLLPVSLNDMLPENYVDESNETVKKL